MNRILLALIIIMIGLMGWYFIDRAYESGKENIINQVQENYLRICNDFDMTYTEIREIEDWVIGCKFINEKNQTRLWTSYVKLER